MSKQVFTIAMNTCLKICKCVKNREPLKRLSFLFGFDWARPFRPGKKKLRNGRGVLPRRSGERRGLRVLFAYNVSKNYLYKVGREVRKRG